MYKTEDIKQSWTAVNTEPSFSCFQLFIFMLFSSRALYFYTAKFPINLLAFMFETETTCVIFTVL